jgi:hypothetical protein
MQDPADQWLVYDEWRELPAEANDTVLIGLSKAEAESFAYQANLHQLLLWLQNHLTRQHVRLR